MPTLRYSAQRGTVRVPVLQRSPLRRNPVVERIPILGRSPISREYLAAAVATNKAHPVQKRMDMPDKLYNGIRKLVYQRANSYAINSRDEVDDLAQSCLFHIWERIHKYDPSRGAFSTFIWHICRSVLNGNYSNDQKHIKNLDSSGDEALENASLDDNNHCSVRGQIKDAIVFLFDEYPNMEDVLSAMFMSRDNPIINEKIVIAQIARDTGRKYSDVYRFFRGQVQRVFADFMDKPQARRRRNGKRRRGSRRRG